MNVDFHTGVQAGCTSWSPFRFTAVSFWPTPTCAESSLTGLEGKTCREPGSHGFSPSKSSNLWGVLAMFRRLQQQSLSLVAYFTFGVKSFQRSLSSATVTGSIWLCLTASYAGWVLFEFDNCDWHEDRMNVKNLLKFTLKDDIDGLEWKASAVSSGQCALRAHR